MYSVVLVDDEYLELELLEKHVRWDQLGFHVAAAAKNGREGLELVERLRPDVLITDVKMPFMDGIALTEQVHRRYPNTRIIFLSGYNQFDYLKAAFHVEAVDYLLKPVDLDELSSLMTVVKGKCELDCQKKSTDTAAALERARELLVSGSPDGWAEKAEELRLLFNRYLCAEAQNGQFHISLITIDELDYIANSQGICAFTAGDFHALVARLAERLPAISFLVREDVYILISYRQPDDAVYAWKAENETIQGYMTACLWEGPLDTARIPQALSHLCDLRGWLVRQTGTGLVRTADEIEQAMAREKAQSQETVHADKGLLLQFMQRGEQDNIQAYLVDYFGACAEDDIYNRAFELLDTIYGLYVLPDKTLAKWLEEKPGFYKRLSYIKSASLLRDVIQEQILKLMCESTIAKGPDPSQNIVHSAQRYVEAHYQEPFTIEAMSECMNYTPNYIRFIFKKVTGETLLEYITEMRMERASRMLRDTPMRIRDISFKVGYTNPSYFCSLFLKRYGVTPQQYRSRVKYEAAD